MDHPHQRLPESGAAGEDNERSDRDEHGPGRELAGETGRDGGSNDAAGDQPRDIDQRDAAEQDEKGNGAGKDDKEFSQTDGADDVPGVLSFGDQGAGDEGAPAAAGEGVCKAADGGQPACSPDLITRFPAGECLPHDIIAEIDRIKGKGDADIIGIFFPKIGQGSAENSTDHSRNDDRPEQFLIDITEAMVAIAGDAAGEDACGMYAAADDRGADAIGKEESGRDGAVAKAHRAIDELGQEAGQRHNAEGAGVEFARDLAEKGGEAAKR